MSFQKLDETLYGSFPEGIPTNKWACFDLDWTLTYNRKKLFPNDEDDIFLLPGRLEILNNLVKDNYSIFIFTNQYAYSHKVKTKKLNRIKTFLNKIKIPVWVFVALGKDKPKKSFIDPYRKPKTGMYDFATKQFGIPQEVFFCGDAAGRPQDFSNSDLEFAKNCGIYFRYDVMFPEQIPPRNTKDTPELVIFVGAPGTGKTTCYKEHYEPLGYIHVNQDTLKTQKKVLQLIEESFKTGKSIVVDSMNNKLRKRQSYYNLVPGYKTTVIYFARDGRGFNSLRKKVVPIIVYHKFFKYLDFPTEDECDLFCVL